MRSALGVWVALPRAGRWLIAAAVGIGVYFLLVEPELDASALYRARASALEMGLARAYERRTEDSEVGRTLSLARARFGSPRLPSGIAGSDNREQTANARIESILRGKGIYALSIKARAPMAIGRDVMSEVLEADQQVQRLVIDLGFEADPDTALAVISELERAPEIATISRLSLRKVEKNGRRYLQVSVSPEAWVVSRKGQRR